MTIYYVIIMIAFLADPILWSERSKSGYYLNYDAHHDKTPLEKKYLFLCAALLFVVMCLRDASVGIDIANYKRMYISNYFTELIDIHDAEEAGFKYYMYFMRYIGLGWQTYLTISALIIYLPWIYLFYKYSEDVYSVFLLNLVLGIFPFAMSGFRQSMAISITIVAFECAVRRKPVWFALLVLLARTVHTSAIVFLLAYPVVLFASRIQSKKTVWMLFGVSVGFMAFGGVFAPLIERVMPERYEKYGEVFSDVSVQNPIVLLCFVGILVVMAFLWREPERGDKICLDNIFYLFGCLTVIFTIYGNRGGQIGRLAYYFQLFMCIGVTNAIRNAPTLKMQRIMRVGCHAVSVLALFITYPGITTKIDNFKFFW